MHHLEYNRESKCELVCIPPDKAHLIWPKVAPLIWAAMKRGGIGSFKGVADCILTGRGLLWLAFDGQNIQAVAVTEINETEWRRVCEIVACGGAHRHRWIGLLDMIEDYARSERCTAMRIIGRRGWTRVLPEYRVHRVIIEKDL